MGKHPPFPKFTLFQILTFLVAGIALLLIFNLSQKWFTWREVQARKQEVAAEVESLRARVSALEQQLLEAQQQEQAEKAFREEFGWVKENEGTAFLQYADEPSDMPAPASSETLQPASPPYWLEWADAFLGPSPFRTKR